MCKVSTLLTRARVFSDEVRQTPKTVLTSEKSLWLQVEGLLLFSIVVVCCIHDGRVFSIPFTVLL